MSVFDDIIDFDNSDSWERVITISKTAETNFVNPNLFTPLDNFDLGVTLNESYIAIAVQTTQGKDTWSYGGKIRQSWNFPKGNEAGSTFAKIQSPFVKLGLNLVQIVKLPKIDSDSFKLIFYPPKWFKDLIVIGWIYTGEVNNFVGDSLNAVTANLEGETLNNLTQLISQVNSINQTVNNVNERLNTIESLLNNNNSSSSLSSDSLQQFDSIVSQNVSQINTDINELSNNLRDVLAGNSDPSILTEVVNNYNINDEFI